MTYSIEPMPDEPTPGEPGGDAPRHPPPAVAQTGGYEFKCIRCGYNLRGIPTDALCPECGTPVSISMQGLQNLPTSGKSIASLVLGILSIVGCLAYGLPGLVAGAIAIPLGISAKRAVQRGEAGSGSAGFAQAGVICGIIGAALGLIYAAVMGFFIFVIATTP